MSRVKSNFRAIFTAEAVADILRNEEAKYRMRRAAYGAILNQSKAELTQHMRDNPALIDQAPELITYLLRYGKGRSPEAKVLRGAAFRLGIVLKELGRLPAVH